MSPNDTHPTQDGKWGNEAMGNEAMGNWGCPFTTCDKVFISGSAEVTR
jgi:hypothetical protein